MSGQPQPRHDGLAVVGHPPPITSVETLFAGDTPLVVGARAVFSSPCTDDELNGKLPKKDDAFNGFNDVALIRLEQPIGMKRGFAPVPQMFPKVKDKSQILLLQFPGGQEKGIYFGKIARVKGISARWQHNIETEPGSSGGPCFDTRLRLVGLHQGRWPPNGRLVPVGRFFAELQVWIAKDIAPPVLWSLSDAPEGPLVIGRDLFFQTIAVSAKPSTRVKGLRIKRPQGVDGATGLGFSLEMLKRVLLRQPGKHQVLEINIEPPFYDLLDDIARRVAALGYAVGSVEAGEGAQAGQTTAEATLIDRARILAARLNQQAETAGQLLWLFFAHSGAGLNTGERIALEGLVAAALTQPALRVVLAGYETLGNVGLEFETPEVPAEGPPGLVLEWLRPFTRADVETMLTRAWEQLWRPPADPVVIKNRADEILLGLASQSGFYSLELLPQVSKRAWSHLDYFERVGRS